MKPLADAFRIKDSLLDQFQKVRGSGNSECSGERVILQYGHLSMSLLVRDIQVAASSFYSLKAKSKF